MHEPIDSAGLERRRRVLRALFDKYRRLRDEGRAEEAAEHLRITSLYATASMEETLRVARKLLRRLEGIDLDGNDEGSPGGTRRSAG